MWATHLSDEVEGGDEVVVLARGKVLLSGRSEEIIATSGAGTLEKLIIDAAEGEDGW
jgi:ABC-type Na+ transport system ATPase subunit NatA